MAFASPPTLSETFNTIVNKHLINISLENDIFPRLSYCSVKNLFNSI